MSSFMANPMGMGSAASLSSASRSPPSHKQMVQSMRNLGYSREEAVRAYTTRSEHSAAPLLLISINEDCVEYDVMHLKISR